MKKFLSLVLALVMTMSLVTIGAGATEYKDLTDKSEIKYEEAVAVLNKIGIITGYEDGSFKPTNNLTRGAAAKIIVSLMIGAEAASALTVNAAPYKDVPVTNAFAAYISYCKTAGYISGYSDGSFRPGDPLTGYAFSKMLLGALGYSSKIEGFTGTGWNMKVASLANKAGLLNGIASFGGNTAVTREVACQLALNTLKATTVEYKGTTGSVVIGDTTVNLGNNQYSYVTSNNKDINANIKGKGAGDSNSDYITLEFGEEHFPDLKLVQSTVSDSFGRPSSQWSYRNVKIGTYARTADFTFSNTAGGDTLSDNVKDMGIKDYTVQAGTVAVVNGSTTTHSVYTDAGKPIKSVTDIPDLLGKGTLVQLYISDTTANQITNVVVIRTQLMQINSVTSSAVTLKKVEGKGLTVASVKDGDAAFKTLSGMKADDYVLVVPVEDTANNYVVSSVSVPTTTSGKLSKITLNSKGDAVTGVTVGGTEYKMSYNWSSQDGELKPNTSLTSNKEATAYVDSYGYAIYVSNVVASNSVIVVDDVYDSLIDGKIIHMLNGWDINGNALSLNMGTATLPSDAAGKTYEYAVSTSNNAEYALVDPSDMVKTTQADSYVLPGATKLDLNGSGSFSFQYFDANVKFVFLSKDGTGKDVTGITVKEGVSEVGSSTTKYPLTYVLNKDKSKITAVIVPNDNDAAVTANLIYISKIEGIQTVDNQPRSIFTAYIDGVKTEGCVASKNNAAVGFYTYTKNDTTGIYTLSAYTQKAGKATSVLKDVSLVSDKVVDKTYIPVSAAVTGTASVKDLNAKNAIVIDLTSSGKNYGSLKDLLDDTTTTGYTVSLVYNDGNSTGKGTVSYLYVTARNSTVTPPTPVPGGKYSTVVDSTKDISALLDMSKSSNAVIDSSYAITTLNVLSGANLQTQIKDFLAYKGFTNIGNVTFDAGSYKVTATNADGIVVTVTLANSAIKSVYTVKLNGATVAYANNSNKADLALNADTYPANGNGTGYICNESTQDVMAYTAYASGSTNKSIGADHDVNIKTGYVDVGDVTDGSLTNFSVKYYAGANEITKPASGKGYMPYNTELKAVLTVTSAITAAGNADTLDAGATTATITCSQEKAINKVESGVATFATSSDGDLAEGTVITINYGTKTTTVGAITIAYATNS